MSEEKIIDKIKKLLSLSKSSNEHEAALAAARATELMIEHQISEAKLETGERQEEIGEHSVGDTDKSMVIWKGELAKALAQTLGCEMFWQTRHDAVAGRRVHTQIVGKTSDVQTVEYLYLYLVAEISRLAEESYNSDNDPVYQQAERAGAHFSHRSHAARQWKEAFRLGAAHTVSKRVAQQRAKTIVKARAQSRGTTALIVIDKALEKLKKDNEAIAEYMKAKKLGKKQSRVTVRDDGYRAGTEAGEDINLNGGRGLNAGAKRLKE